MTNNLSFLDKLVEDLIKAKHHNYSQQCLTYYIDDQKYITEDLQNVKNVHNQKIKCTLVKHRSNHKHRPTDNNINQICILYLHGLGSSRLQSLSLLQNLPKKYCLCMFDMSGSGKSEGQYITYGIKEYQDIDSVISYLNKKKYIRQFVLWGRSMGAVATLLYACKNYSESKLNEGKLKKSKKIQLAGRTERVSSSKNIIQFETPPQVKAIILDSPFHNYKEIAKQIAIKKLNIPTFIIDMALSYIEQSFGRILNNVGSQYNPFLINFDKKIKLTIPILFLYSQKDEVIPSWHCQKIIKNIQSRFQKMIINQCTHNQIRPTQVIQQIFNQLQKFDRQNVRQNNAMNFEHSKQINLHQSIQKKRGICVYTPSKQIKRLNSSESKILIKESQIIDLDQIKTQQPYVHSPKKKSSLVRRSLINIQSMKMSKQIDYDTISSENICLQQMQSLDLLTSTMISNKLISNNDSVGHHHRLSRTKKLPLEKRRESKLTNLKYLG